MPGMGHFPMSSWSWGSSNRRYYCYKPELDSHTALLKTLAGFDYRARTYQGGTQLEPLPLGWLVKHWALPWMLQGKNANQSFCLAVDSVNYTSQTSGKMCRWAWWWYRLLQGIHDSLAVFKACSTEEIHAWWGITALGLLSCWDARVKLSSNIWAFAHRILVLFDSAVGKKHTMGDGCWWEDS